ncbi:MAG: hypothetical protein QM820_40215 [Minicystis sp.]
MNRVSVAMAIVSGLILGSGCGGGGEMTSASSGIGSSSGSAGGSDAGHPSVTCADAEPKGIMITDVDALGGQPFALGYPPYAIDGCRLLYVAPGTSPGSSGELRLRDLQSGKETAIEPAGAHPRRPAARGGWMAWEATENGVAVVRASSGQEILTMKGPFDHAGEPRCAEGAVVFTGWLGPKDTADTDVFVFQPATGSVIDVSPGPGQQRFPDVSATHIAWTDFAEDPDGTFDDNAADAADIALLDRGGGAPIARKLPGKQAFAMLGAPGRIAYLSWGLVHPEPKFSEFDLRVGDLVAAVDADVTVDHVITQSPYVRPAALGKWLEWVRWPAVESPSLLRRPADLSAPASAIPTLDAMELYTPTASDALTLVGARAPGGPLTLAIFSR